jgi:hypothetical protein
MKSIYTLIWLVVASQLSFAQSGSLTEMTKGLQGAVGNVQTASKSYESKVQFIEPAGIQYTFDEIDSKGNKVNYVYEFNVADIDPYAVREQTQKDVITVVVAVKNKQKLVKVMKNNEVQPYEEQALIHAKDIENARKISEIIKKGIPAAEKIMASRLKLANYDAMVDWLTKNVKNVALGTKSYTQTMAKADKPGSMRLTQVEADGKTSTEETYTFNLADINTNSITFKITGNKFAVNFETLQKAKYIAARKNTDTRPFTNEITINTNNVDEARDLKTVLTLVAPLAVGKVKADIPAMSTEKEALSQVKNLTTDIAYGPKQITQKVEPACITVLSIVESDAKASVKNDYKFNWMDVNPNASQIDVTGERLYIDLKIADGKKLMMNSKDEKFNGYDNSVRLLMPDIENARRAKFAIDKAIEKCKASYKEPFAADAKSTTIWVMSNVKETAIDEVTAVQKLERVDDGNLNKYKFTARQVNAKGTGSEEIFEFNLSDINPLSVEVDVKGKWLYVVMETEFKGKVIKAYKDGKIQPYANKLELAINDVDVARNVVSALKKAIATQKGK